MPTGPDPLEAVLDGAARPASRLARARYRRITRFAMRAMMQAWCGAAG